MKLDEFKQAVCQLAYDISSRHVWHEFDDYVLRYGANLCYDAMLFDDFYVAISTQLDKPKFYDVMDHMFQKLRRADVVEFMRAVSGSREYHNMLSSMTA